MTEYTAKERLARDLEDGRKWIAHDNRAVRVLLDNDVVAQNTVAQEMGRFGTPEWAYELDRLTKNTLSVHTRQDAAYTLLNTISLIHGTDRLVRLTEKHIRVLQVWMCALTLGIIFLIWKAL
jgi:hypothetical protein